MKNICSKYLVTQKTHNNYIYSTNEWFYQLSPYRILTLNLKYFIRKYSIVKFLLIFLVVLATGCSSTKEAVDTNSTAKTEKKKSCTSIKVMGSKIKKRVCKS